jgi:hypothetical protein
MGDVVTTVKSAGYLIEARKEGDLMVYPDGTLYRYMLCHHQNAGQNHRAT